FGIGICTGLKPGCVVGLSIADSFGCSPICDRRSIEEQPLARQLVASSRAEIAMRGRREAELYEDMTYSDLAGACETRSCGVWACAIWAGDAGAWTRFRTSAAVSMGAGASSRLSEEVCS